VIAFQMSEEQSHLVSLVSDLLAREVRPLIQEINQGEQGSYDWRPLESLASINMLAPNIPRKYGGRGLGFVTLALIIEEVAAVCAGLSSCMVGTIHAILPILIGGSEEQKHRYLQTLVNGEPALAAFALSEPKGGSDIQRLDTVYQQSGEYYVLNGVKDYVTNGGVAEFVTVCANADRNSGRGSYQFFVVPQEQVKVTANRKTMGLKYCNTAQLLFEDALISNDEILGSSDTGYLLLSQTLDCGRALIAASEVGIARAAYELVLAYAQTREQFGRPIFSNQGVSFPLVEMATAIDAARFMVWRACYLIDQDGDYTRASSMARLYASQVAQKVTAQAIDIMGAAGYTDDSLLSIYFRDAKSSGIVGGTDNVQKMIIASLL
jgi:alkylation response protein AidB-like acyl-CoA dehydrogenase